jgi:hypothetical protein
MFNYLLIATPLEELDRSGNMERWTEKEVIRVEAHRIEFIYHLAS